MIHHLKIAGDTNHPTDTSNRKKESEQKSLAQIRAEFAEELMDKIRGTDFESEEERIKFQKKIERKIKSGKKLSRKEMNYLRKYNPYMYCQMVRVQRKREALKERLKHCRSKEEAQRVMRDAFSSISDKDPVREAMVAAVQNVSEQFRSSEAYKKLPDTEEDLKKIKKVEKSASNPFQQDEEDGGCDGAVYEPVSYSFGKSGYQEAILGDLAESNTFAWNA